MIHLTGQNYNARDIIRNIFSPLVGVISSPFADELCHRNNLSFVELLQPFAKLPSDAHFRDVSGTSVSIRGLRLNFCDVDWRPPQTVLARKMLNEAVTTAQNDKTKIMSMGSVNLELPTAEPWFDQWRETFLTVQFPADHEFTRHFLSCLIVLSSGDPNIVETAHKLTQRIHQMQNVTPQKLPKWFQPNDVLNSYIVLHEGCQGDLSKAQQGYELLKSTFGDSKCFLIQINSLDGTVASELTDYWASFIKRQPKADTQSDQMSAPKTPQDAVSVISMPSMQMSALEAAAANDNDMPILHPLSPVQENPVETISSKFSISSESLASQNINPNVWAGDMESDAPHGNCLNAMDVENLRHFVQDYAVRALIPYVEHLVVVLNEAITNKKGVSKSLLSATKRWFVTSKPGASASNQNAVIYTHESAELQTRKLGDLYFMFGHYNLAFQAYHQAKRDFNADSAWQYYAGALEMAAVSAFMLGTANRKTYDYMEDAIVCYLTVCKLQQFATRATLLSMECLKTARLYGEAAKQLIRMTSEESDLRSALLLEQAAYCFLATQPSMHRKYAFHIVLSGNRYSRTGQRKHAYRCYRQAYEVFQNHGWSLAEDHIQYTMAKQAYTLKKLEEASRSFAHLLRPGSLQSAHQQASFLKEYIQTQNELIKRNTEVGLLPHALPQVIQDSIRVLVLAQPPIANPLHVPASSIDISSDLLDEPTWHKIEEMIVSTAAGNKPFVFKPSRSLFTKENPTTDYPVAVQGEPIEIAVRLLNTVKCSINLTDIDLLWRLRLDNDEELTNLCLYDNSKAMENKAAVSAAIKTTCNQSIVLDERMEKTVVFKVLPKLTGRLNVIGMVSQMAAVAEPTVRLQGSLLFEAHKIRAIGKPTASSSTQSLFDNKLSINIIPSVPALNVSFSIVPLDLIAGEIIPVTVSLRNSGILPIDDVYLGCESPRWITLQDGNAEVPLSILSSVRDLSSEKYVKDKEIRRQHVFRLSKNNSSLVLKAQECATIPMWIQAPYQKGKFTLRLLFYYGISSAANESVKYRLVRHRWIFNVHECLNTEVTCVISNTLSGEMGLHVDVKNDNNIKDHISTELYINSMHLLCAEYKLNTSKLYFMNQMEISAGQLGERCLQSSKSASFQCRLEQTSIANKGITKMLTLDDYPKKYLSQMDIMPTKPGNVGNPKDNQMPALAEMYSFLIKHETKYFNLNISAEEFNSIIAVHHPHATIILNWTVQMTMNNEQRYAFGQHFVQLHQLYESGGCPSRNARMGKLSKMEEKEILRICDFSSKDLLDIIRRESDNREMCPHNDDNDDTWETNDFAVGRRCLLEDENFALTIKA